MNRTLCLILLLFSNALFAAELSISADFERFDFNEPIATFLDTDRLQIDDIAHNQVFSKTDYAASLSPNSHVYWYRITLDGSELERPKELALISKSHLLQNFDVFLFRHKFLVATEKHGIIDRVTSSDVYTGIDFEFTIFPDEQLTLLLRKETSGPSIMPLSLLNEDKFVEHKVMTLFFWGCAFGILAALAIYNGFIYSLNRHSAQYGWYMVFQLFMFLHFSPLLGFGYLVFPDEFVRWLATHMGVLHLILLWSALMFSYHFLDMHQFRPKLAKLVLKANWVFPLLIVFAGLTLNESQRMLLTSPLMVVVSYMCIGTAITALRNRYYPAMFYLLSWLCTFAGAVCGYLTYSNLLPQNLFTINSFLVGVMAEQFLLSVSLAKRLQFQEQKEKQHRLIDQTLNMPNQNFCHYALKEQLASRGTNLVELRLVLLQMEGIEQQIGTLGTDIVSHETKQLLKEVSRPISVLPWQFNLKLDKEYFGVCIPPNQVLVFVDKSENEKYQVEQLLHIIQNKLDRSLYLSDVTLRAASADTDSDGDETLLLHQKAYMALQEARKLGVKWLPYNDEMIEKVEKHILTLHELKLAVSQNSIDIFLQPQFDLASNEITGAEALMRWLHPTLGYIPPNVYIPIAEQSGLIHSLTKLVIEKMFDWQSKVKAEINLSINISVLDIHEPDFVTFLATKSDEYQIDRTKFILEITESEELDNSVDFVRTITEIKKLGFSISVDDFGTGYSSMAYLSQLMIDEVKIDRAFVTSIHNNETNQTIVKTLMNMAQALGAHVVIEGIETVNELNVLKTFGPSYGQGFYWSPAIDLNKFERTYLRSQPLAKTALEE
jgi:EAL domain-containing protein (putative c-di-GMP-specific phosphodiesterase class I)